MIFKHLSQIFNYQAAESEDQKRYIQETGILLEEKSFSFEAVLSAFIHIYKTSDEPQKCFEKYAQSLVDFARINNPGLAGRDFVLLYEALKDTFKKLEFCRTSGRPGVIIHRSLNENYADYF